MSLEGRKGRSGDVPNGDNELGRNRGLAHPPFSRAMSLAGRIPIPSLAMSLAGRIPSSQVSLEDRFEGETESPFLKTDVTLQPAIVVGPGRGGSCPVLREVRTASMTAETGLWPRCLSVRKTLINTAWVSAPDSLPLA
jgi:hypothetical protein